MPAIAQQAEIPPQPLTALTEEEKLFQTTVRQFAREQIGPYVREMDEAGVFRKDLIRQFFELGLMGIEIPEEYGGSGGSFFQCILAVEELSAVDPSAGVIADSSPAETAQLIWASIHGWVSLELLGIGFVEDQAAGYDRVCTSLLRGLRP